MTDAHSNTWAFGPGQEFSDLNVAILAMLDYFQGNPLTEDQFILGVPDVEPYRLMNPLNSSSYKLNSNGFRTIIGSLDINNRIIFTGREIIPANTFLKQIESQEPSGPVWKSNFLNIDTEIYENKVPLVRKTALIDLVPGSYFIDVDYTLYLIPSDSSKARINHLVYEATTKDYIFKWQSADNTDKAQNINIVDIDFEHTTSNCIQFIGTTDYDQFDGFHLNNCRFKSNHGAISINGAIGGIRIETSGFIDDNNSNNPTVITLENVNNIECQFNYSKVGNTGRHLQVIKKTGVTTIANIDDNMFINGSEVLYVAVDNLGIKRNIFRRENPNPIVIETIRLNADSVEFWGNAILGSFDDAVAIYVENIPSIIDIISNTFWSELGVNQTIVKNITNSTTVNFRINLASVRGTVYDNAFAGDKDSNVYLIASGVAPVESNSRHAIWRNVFSRPLEYGSNIAMMDIIPNDRIARGITSKFIFDSREQELTYSEIPCFMDAGCIQRGNLHENIRIESFRWPPYWFGTCSLPDGVYSTVEKHVEHYSNFKSRNRKYNFDCPLPFTDFVFKVDTTKIQTGSTGNDKFQLPMISTGNYNFLVNWGDGDEDHILSYNNPRKLHTYPSPGIYTITIYGRFRGWTTLTSKDSLKLIEITHWGNSIEPNNAFFFNWGAFAECKNLVITATDILKLTATQFNRWFLNCISITTIPNLNNWDMSPINDLTSAFAGCTNFNEPIGNWDVSNVTTFVGLFSECSMFNQNIGNWDVSSVTSFSGSFIYAKAFNNGGSDSIRYWNTDSLVNCNNAFNGCLSFNQPLDGWDVSNVTNMFLMFQDCPLFNQNINNWDTSSVTTMAGMFAGATSFNQPLSNWNTGNVTLMNDMFKHAASFNNPLNTWNTSKVTNMYHMFELSGFNQPLSNWNTSKVTNMDSMFSLCPFNQNINNWDVSKVTDFQNMFYANSVFNQPLGNWNTVSAVNMSTMFRSTPFNQDISLWNVSNVTNFQNMFLANTVFDQNISAWNVEKATTLSGMFQNATAFKQNIGNWWPKSCTSMLNMFLNTDMNSPNSTTSRANYDALLVGWTGWSSGLPGAKGLALQNNVVFNAGTAKYTLSSDAAAARAWLVTPVISGGKGWTITDGGGVGSPPVKLLTANETGTSKALLSDNSWVDATYPVGEIVQSVSWSGLFWVITTASGKVYTGTNGTTWILRISGLSAITCYAIDNVIALASFNNGMYISTDGGVNWSFSVPYTGSPQTFVRPFIVKDGANYRIFAHGQAGAGYGSGTLYSAESTAPTVWTSRFSSGSMATVYTITNGDTAGKLVFATTLSGSTFGIGVSYDYGLTWSMTDMGVVVGNGRSLRWSSTHNVYFLADNTGKIWSCNSALGSLTLLYSDLGGAVDNWTTYNGISYCSAYSGGTWTITPTTHTKVSATYSSCVASPLS